MIVSVVRVWKVRMRVCQWLVPVRMAVLDARCYRRIMIVLVVFIVNMFMAVHHRFVDMLVFMTLSQMQPSTKGHQGAGYE